jgi:hypothetical protein
VALEEVAPLHALAAAARGVAVEAGERVQRRLGRLTLVSLVVFLVGVLARALVRRGRRLVGRVVVVIGASALLRGVR